MARLAAIGALALLLALVGCGDDIASGPTNADLEAERARLAAQVNKGNKLGARAKQKTKVVEARSADSGFASVGEAYTYDSTGRRDPFEPYRIEVASLDEETGGPLEQFELEQMSVVALIWDAGTPHALVTDPSGTTYTVRVGSRMGKNAGRVIHIGDNLVLVKETYTDYAGEESTKDVELRIRRSQGG